MSWDIIVQDFPDVTSVSEIPDDFQPAAIGTRSALIARIKAAIPSADFSDPSWGLIVAETGSVEVNIGDDEQCDSLMLHVRGGEGAFPLVVALLEAVGLRAIDCQTGEFFDPSASQASFATWRDYRDQVVAGYEPKPASSLWGRFLGLFR
jgi:hypothetical protein